MRKTLEILKNILVTLLVILSVGIMVFTVISVNTFNRNDRSLFGYKFFIVLSDSMKATDFAAGDVVVIKEVDPSTLQEGDIISYESTSAENFGEVVTHKIRSKTTDANGEPGFITYGTTTNTDDEAVVTYLYVLGKYQFHLPKIGTFFQFMKTVPGYFTCIFLPFMLLILFQAYNTLQNFRAYKKEQLAEIQAEKDAQAAALAEERQRLAQERAEQQRMMQEFMAMRQQMGVPVANPVVPPVTPSPAPTQTQPQYAAPPVEAPKPTPTAAELENQRLQQQMAAMQAQMEAMRRQMAQQSPQPTQAAAPVPLSGPAEPRQQAPASPGVVTPTHRKIRRG